MSILNLFFFISGAAPTGWNITRMRRAFAAALAAAASVAAGLRAPLLLAPAAAAAAGAGADAAGDAPPPSLEAAIAHAAAQL